MGFFNDAWKAAENLGQEAAKRAGPAAAEACKHVDKFGQEVGKHAMPAAKDALKQAGTICSGSWPTRGRTRT
jgi:hypothetical protein